MSIESDEVAAAVEILVKGAKVQHMGKFLGDDDMILRGVKLIAQAICTIDAKSPTGRDVLIPLLDYDDDGVRVTAAGGLWQSRKDLAVPVLKTIRDTCITEAHFTAFIILMTNGHVASCCPDPRYPPETEKWGDKYF